MVRPRAVSSTAILMLDAIWHSPSLVRLRSQLTFGQGEMLLNAPPASSGICTSGEKGSRTGAGVDLVRPEFGLRFHARLSLLLADLAVLEVAAFDGALGRLVPLRQPVAERVAVPRGLRPQLRQAELFPQLPRALHVFALGERKRRHVALHRGVHQQRRVLLLPVLALGAVALAAVRQRLHVLKRAHAAPHGPPRSGARL